MPLWRLEPRIIMVNKARASYNYYELGLCLPLVLLIIFLKEPLLLLLIIMEARASYNYYEQGSSPLSLLALLLSWRFEPLIIIMNEGLFYFFFLLLWRLEPFIIIMNEDLFYFFFLLLWRLEPLIIIMNEGHLLLLLL
jgi:hypothetical protein